MFPSVPSGRGEPRYAGCQGNHASSERRVPPSEHDEVSPPLERKRYRGHGVNEPQVRVRLADMVDLSAKLPDIVVAQFRLKEVLHELPLQEADHQ
jgi:hypothetical protein